MTIQSTQRQPYALQANAMQPYFSGKTATPKACAKPSSASEDIERFLPKANLSFPTAAVDVGSNSVKLLLRKADGSLHFKRYGIYLGASIGQSGKITAPYQKKLKAVFDDIANYLITENGVKQEHIAAVATAALREASNGADMVQYANNLGIPLHTIDGLEEASLIYGSTLQGTGIHKKQPVIVMECGGGSTEYAYGNGLEGFGPALSSVMTVGTSRLGLKDVNDAQEIARIRADIRKGLKDTITPAQKEAATGRRLYIKRYSYFNSIPAVPGVITRADIANALKPEGLEKLSRSLEGSDMSLPNLVSKLCILDETLAYLGKDKIRLGADGGLKFALLSRLIKELDPNAQ